MPEAALRIWSSRMMPKRVPCRARAGGGRPCGGPGRRMAQVGLFLATGGGHDVMVVDRMLPNLDGLSMVARGARGGIATPAIFLTARAGVGDRVEGLRRAATTTWPNPSPSPSCWRASTRWRAPAALAAGSDRAARRRPRDGPDPPRGDACGQAHRAAAARIPPVLEYLMRARPGGDAHHAAGRRVGLPLRPQGPAWWRPISAGCAARVDKGFDRELIHTMRGAGYVIRAGWR